MSSILPFDEIEKFRLKITQLLAGANENKRKLTEEEEEDIIDELLDLFLLAYANGVNATNESLSSNWQPTIEEVMETVDKKVVGKTWRERVEEYFASGGNVEDYVRIAETESHRDANEAAYTTAVHAGATQKTWVCMMIPTSRDSHIFLNGTTIPIEAEFYADDGSHAKFPGEFGVPEQDCNCLCVLSFE